jgi:signal transduction histidine kinase
MEEGRSLLGERQYRREDGSLADVEVSVSAVPYDGREVMSVVAHDVSERKRAERAMEEIREAERNRIARELHDSALQDIVYALQEIQVVQVVSEGANLALEDSTEALRRSVEGLRGAIFELRLEDTLGRSFVSSLENLIDLDRRMARDRYEVELVVEDGFPSGLSAKASRELARIIQEALTNIRHHADARHVQVKLGLDGQVAYIEVSDDGRGFVTESPRCGVGQHSMHRRALEIGGELQVESEPGAGTRVRCLSPGLSGVAKRPRGSVRALRVKHD